MWDIQTDQVQISNELTRIFEEDRKIKENNYQDLMEHILPEDRIVLRRAIQAALNHDNLFSFQFRITQNDGTLRLCGDWGRSSAMVRMNPPRLSEQFRILRMSCRWKIACWKVKSAIVTLFKHCPILVWSSMTLN